jgi:hypothetical protein
MLSFVVVIECGLFMWKRCMQIFFLSFDVVDPVGKQNKNHSLPFMHGLFKKLFKNKTKEQK